LISDLQQNNFDKFEAVKDILHTEILKNKELEKNITEYIKPSFIKNVDFKINSDVDSYNLRLDTYNQKFIESANNLISPSKDSMVTDLANSGEQLLQRV